MRKNEWGLSTNRNSQTRMTNDEIRRNDQTRMDETGDRTTQRIWTFGLRISFVIRHSTTYANQVHGPNACGKTNAGFHERPPLPALSPSQSGGEGGPRPGEGASVQGPNACAKRKSALGCSSLRRKLAQQRPGARLGKRGVVDGAIQFHHLDILAQIYLQGLEQRLVRGRIMELLAGRADDADGLLRNQHGHRAL